MNPYLLGVVTAVIFFTLIGLIAGNQVKDTNDYYVAGRRAPVILISGSLIASFLSTGAFMGDTGEIYNGFFMGIVIVGIIQASGYVYGAGLFGKYIRRAKVNTIPEYFGNRFDSKRVRVLASIILVVAVVAYLLSAIEGVSTLMMQITGLEYRKCVVAAWMTFTIFTIYSGSMGVLITDTIMFLFFLAAALVGVPFIVSSAGGWGEGITALACSTSNPGIISWSNNLSYRYPTGAQNLVWAVVVMISPWQTSRYLMAKNEHVVMRSSVYASMGVLTVTMLLYFSAAFVYEINPNLENGSICIIWAAMNCMPLVVGIIMLTGIMAAGISSASTFLSLIGTSLLNDLMKKKNGSINADLQISRTIMGIVSIFILFIAYFNPPQIFWIMYFGGTVIASAWGVPAIASVWSEKMSEPGAFWGMLLGFFGSVFFKCISVFGQINLPMYADPFFVGLIFSILGTMIGSWLAKASFEDIQRCRALHIKPESEKDSKESRKTHNLMWLYLLFGVLLGVTFVSAYAIPYLKAIS